MTLPTVKDARLQLENRIATLTLARDDVRNALTGTALIDDIVNVAEWVNACDEASVLVITGEGSAFSAGGNVKDMAARGGDFAGDVAEVATRYRQGIQRIPLALQAVEVPIIAAVKARRSAPASTSPTWPTSASRRRRRSSARPSSTSASSPATAAPGSCSA
jgi:enoyl-CoA hydratase/carnithine racemase